MLDFLSSIVGFFETVMNFLLMTVESLFNLIRMIPQALNFVGNSVSFLPSVTTTFIMAGVTFSIILLIVGRNT